MMLRYLITILLLSLCLCGCSSPQTVTQELPDFSGYSGTVTLYSSMQEEQLQAIKNAFEQKYPKIKMKYYFGSTEKVLTKLATEIQAGDINADLLWTSTPLDFISLKENRVLSPYISPQAININPALIDENHYYISACIASAGIAYNTNLVTEKEAPHTWNALLNSKWKNKIIFADPSSSGSFKHLTCTLMCHSQYGKAYFQKLRDNNCCLESSTAAVHMQIAEGAYPVGVALDYVTENLRSQGEPIAFLSPKKDNISIACPMGLIAGGNNERNGRLLYDFILSKEGQRLLIDNYLHSVRDDIRQPGPSVQALLDTSLPLDVETIGQKQSHLLKEYDQIFFH